MVRKIFYFSLVMTLLFSGCKNKQQQTDQQSTQEQTEVQNVDIEATEAAEANAATNAKPLSAKELEALAYASLTEEPTFEINTNYGTIVIKLYKETPLHRDNFIKLAKAHYYDSIRFHRVIPHFMIQAGDPYSREPENAHKVGTGGPGYTIPAEFNPAFTHKKGALAAARKGGAANPLKESSGSQFYIVQDEEGCKHLDGEYTIFGETVKGLEVVDRIAAIPTDAKGKPASEVIIRSITPIAPETAPEPTAENTTEPSNK